MTIFIFFTREVLSSFKLKIVTKLSTLSRNESWKIAGICAGNSYVREY